jgi:hypothetical protein
VDPLYRNARAQLVTVFCQPDQGRPLVTLTFVADDTRAPQLGSQACDFLERLHEH